MKTISYMEIFLAQHGNCFYCNKPMKPSRGHGVANFTLDHFQPRSNGHKLNGNVVLCHPHCNFLKGSRQPTASEQIRFKELMRKIKERKNEIKKFIKQNQPEFIKTNHPQKEIK